jgi:hypothetical protein
VIRITSISSYLLLIVVASAFAQNSSTITEAEVCAAEDYVIFRVALSELFAKEKPDRILLRDHTFVRNAEAEMFLPDVPDEAKVDFDSRNKRPARIEGGKIKTSVEITLLSTKEEERLVEEGRGCERKAPVTFVSRPSLNAEHNRALISVGTSCYDNEYSTLMLLGKDSGDWRVVSRLAEDTTTIDRFPPQADPAYLPRGPKIVGVQRSEEADLYVFEVAFIIPNVPNYAFETITVYGTRIVEGQRSDDKVYLSLRGSWKPNDPVEFSVRVPKEFTDPSKGWILSFCVGSTAECYPSSNLLTLVTPKKNR